MKIKTLLIGVACAALLCSPAVAADSNEKNIEDVKANAENGDPKAQYDLGFKYIVGVGVEKDHVEANKWFRKAAEQGYPSAQHMLGYRAWKGVGMKPDLIEAAKWLKLAALVGNDGAAESLAEVIREMSQDQKVEAGVEKLKFLPKKIEFTPVSDHKLLEGLDGVRVEINLQGGATNELTKDRLQTLVELRLRSAGIKVKAGASGPSFKLDVLSVHNEKIHISSYRLRGSLEAETKYKNMWVLGSKLWDYDMISLAGDNNNEQSLINDAQTVVDRFANDYLAGNPKN